MTPTRRYPSLLSLLGSLALCWAASPTRAQLTDLGAHLLDACAAPGDCLANEFFGDALAVCDFDDDGFADLAVGTPEETVGSNDNAGSVHIFYGSPAGLTLAGDQVFDLNDLDLSGGADGGDHLGEALAAGDFDRDGICDLAVAAPGKSVGAPDNAAGAVVILFGTTSGLTGDGFLFLSQNHLPSGSSESPEENDGFGSALAALPNGGLAIGVPYEDFFLVTESNAGLVHLLSTSGPGNPLDSVTDREQNDFLDVCPEGNEFDDLWGWSLVVGRFGSSPSLVIGAPFEHYDGADNAGRITVAGSPEQCFDQHLIAPPNDIVAGDLFGYSLAAGDFNDDGFDDLAIGVPGEDLAPDSDANEGEVQTLFGSASGLQDTGGPRRIDQDEFPNESAQNGDQFGQKLASGDFDGDGFDDLAIGVPLENFGSVLNAGTVHAIYGSLSGLIFNSSKQTFNSDSPPGMPEVPNSDDLFGVALATGDFDGNGTDDLAIGMPGEDLGSHPQAGAVTVLYGLLDSIDAFGTVQFADNAVTVSESADLEILFVTREGGAVLAASIDHDRTGGTATPGGDFSYGGGSESWDVGDLTQNFFLLTVEEDTLDEPNETVVISLSNPSAGTAIGTPATMTLTITDNDVAGALSFVQPVTVVQEPGGLVQIPVQRTGGAASGVTVQFATADNTAQAGLDYVASSGTLTFAANETTRFISVQLLDDDDAEIAEVFHLTLSNPGGGGTLGLFTLHQIVILDNDIFHDGFESGNTTAWSSTAP